MYYVLYILYVPLSKKKAKGWLFFLINVAIPLLTVFLKPHGSLGSEGFVC